MSASSRATSRNEITLNDKGVIVARISGPQNQETSRMVGEEIKKLAYERKASGQRVLILCDLSSLRPKDVAADARREARTLLDNVSFDKAAVYGAGSWLTFIMYLVKVAGLSQKVQFFKAKRNALQWLEDVHPQLQRSSLAAWFGVIIGLIGLLALCGWQLDNKYFMSWIPAFRPINPISALGVFIMGIGFILYWMRKIRWLRLTGVISLCIGVGALLPFGIDYLLYGTRVAAYGEKAFIADSAAICFIAMGVVALVAARNGRWVRPVEYAAVLVMGSLALINIFGQLYAQEWLHGLSGNFTMAYNLAFAFALATAGLILLVLYRKMKINLLTRVTWAGWLIVAVLIFVQVATYTLWDQANARQRSDTAAVFTKNAQSIEEVLTDRFAAYTNALRGYQGLFASSNTINQVEFESYYNATEIDKTYPGLRAISFISKSPTNELPLLTQRVRQDTSLYPAGNPSFAIRQQSSLDNHYILTYVAGNPTAQLGTDFSSNPNRLAAYTQAEKTRQPTASTTVQFAATATNPAREGFFITIPVTYGSDKNTIIGFVNAVFDYQSFFTDSIENKQVLNKVNVAVIDASDNKRVYSVKNANGGEVAYAYETAIKVADRTWHIRATAAADYGINSSNLPTVILTAGQTFSVLLIIIFLMQAQGRRRALALVDEVTKDLQEERNLAVANNQKSMAILSSIGDGVFAIDTKERITVLNPSAASIAGYDAQDAIGKPYNEVLVFEYEKSGKPNDDFIKKALRGHLASMANHTVLVHSNGKRIPVADSAAPIRNAQGEIIGAIVVFRDVSKESELDKAKTEFVSLASHQLRTPLSAINWYGELLLNGDAGKLNKDQREYISEIFEGSQRMVELVNSLLDVSRLEVGRLVDQPAPTNLQELITDLEKELEVSIKEKHMELHKNVELIEPVIADPKQLRMIVQNILSNAVKYTPEHGEVTVELRKATQADMRRANLTGKKDHWFFSVKDTGFGIPKDQQSKIFSKLFRADNVRRLDVEGTGLGLYIVKEVIEKIGGKVWFESMESIGTTFYVVAPMEAKYAKNGRYNKMEKKEMPT